MRSGLENPTEQAVVGFLAAREEEILAFARELVATPSPNPPGD